MLPPQHIPLGALPSSAVSGRHKRFRCWLGPAWAPLWLWVHPRATCSSSTHVRSGQCPCWASTPSALCAEPGATRACWGWHHSTGRYVAAGLMWACAVGLMWVRGSGTHVGVCGGTHAGVCGGTHVGVCSGTHVDVCGGTHVGAWQRDSCGCVPAPLHGGALYGPPKQAGGCLLHLLWQGTRVRKIN